MVCTLRKDLYFPTSIRNGQMMKKRMFLTTCLLAAVSAGMCTAQDDTPSPLRGVADSTFALPGPLAEDISSNAVNPSPSGIAPPNPIPDNDHTGSHPSVEVAYTVERPVTEQINQRGKVVYVTRYVREVQSVRIAVDANLDELDLPPDGKRAAVLAVTAARHEDLLAKLKEAKSDDEKKAAADALKTNYTEHYAIETWWREQRLVELENRLKEMRQQVQQRQDAQEKYIGAAMTIAELWADGIAIAPPKPGVTPQHGSTVVPAYSADPAIPLGQPSMGPATSSVGPAASSFVAPPVMTKPGSMDSATKQRIQ